AGVSRLFLARELRCAHLFELLLSAVTAVRVTRLKHAGENFGVTPEALCLVVRPLVLLQSEPAHAVQNDAHGFLCGALQVRVLDAQDELAAVPARIEPAVQRGTDAADVQQPCGTWRESRDHRHARPSSSIGGPHVSSNPRAHRGVQYASQALD